MNVVPCAVEGDRLRLGEREITLPRRYAPLTGLVEMGVRPEFVKLSADGDGVPVSISAVEDIGRFKIVRGLLEGRNFNAVLPEGAEVPAEASAVIDPTRIGIYHDSHLVRGEA